MKRADRVARNARIIALMRGGADADLTASAYGLSVRTIKRVVRRAGKPPRLCPACGATMGRYAASTTCYRCYRIKDQIQQGVCRIVSRSVRRGEIPSAKALTCVDCGGRAHDYDHRAYSRPLAVEPVCRSCNLRRGPAVDLYTIIRHRLRPVDGPADGVRAA